ncbi:MAG: M48 family metallopeptidase [Burkholderiales bacterium]
MDFNFFTLVFLLVLTLTVAVRLWLASRHVRHVRAHRDRVPSGFTDAISLEAHQKAADYSVAKTRLARINIIVEAALLLAFTLGGLFQLLDRVWRGETGSELLFGVALIASVIVISAIVDLPLSLYRTFKVEARFGFNKMTLGLFFADLAKQALLGALIGLPLIFGVLWLMERMGEYWWLYAWAAWIVFSILMLALYPTLIAPLFNKFNPMDEGQLKERIEKLLAKCGFKSNGLFVMDGSRRSSHGNAYFTGFGRAKRIVFFDTLVNRLEPAEVEAVLAHELGHFKMRHVVKRMLLTFVMSLAFFWLLSIAINAAWFYEGLNAGTPSNAMALVLFVMLAPLVTFPLQPVFAKYSRKHEFEADAYAAAYASAKELVSALVKLYKDNASTLTPDPLHSAVYDSHPPAAIRIKRLQTSV